MDTDITINDILSGRHDSRLNGIYEAVVSRRDYLRRVTAAENRDMLTPGCRVVLSGLKPKYVNGTVATLKTINRTRAVVVMDAPVGRFSGQVTVPLSCLTLATEVTA